MLKRGRIIGKIKLYSEGCCINSSHSQWQCFPGLQTLRTSSARVRGFMCCGGEHCSINCNWRSKDCSKCKTLEMNHLKVRIVRNFEGWMVSLLQQLLIFCVFPRVYVDWVQDAWYPSSSVSKSIWRVQTIRYLAYRHALIYTSLSFLSSGSRKVLSKVPSAR